MVTMLLNGIERLQLCAEQLQPDVESMQAGAE
jgi:hypothetical protein